MGEEIAGSNKLITCLLQFEFEFILMSVNDSGHTACSLRLCDSLQKRAKWCIFESHFRSEVVVFQQDKFYPILVSVRFGNKWYQYGAKTYDEAVDILYRQLVAVYCPRKTLVQSLCRRTDRYIDLRKEDKALVSTRCLRRNDH